MESLIGKTIDNYRILEVIGRGGMGVVLKAVDTSLEKIVALKMIDPFLAEDENFVRRFKTEAKALAKLENPNIVSVHALRETDKGLFMVMEYVDAKPLSKHLADSGPLSIKEIIAVSKQLLSAIGHAHEYGIIHRDIKPSNILLCYDGKIKVTDFGLAKVIQQKGPASTITQARAGTLYYMSPEQVKGLKNVDIRSDIYSLGMTIYEMTAGRVPFEKTDSDFTIQKQIVEGEIPSPIKFNSSIPKKFSKIIQKAIDKDPDKRYQTAETMLVDILNFEKKISQEQTRIHKTSKPKEKSEKTYSYSQGILLKLSSLLGIIKIFIKKFLSHLIKLLGILFKEPILLFSSLSILLVAIFYMFFSNAVNGIFNPVINSNINKEMALEEKISADETKSTTQEKISESAPVTDLFDKNLNKLYVETKPPGAAIFLDGKSFGMSNRIIDSLEIKAYHLIVRLKNYNDSSIIVDLSKTKKISIALTPKIQSLINSDPEGANLFIDGDLIGKTPFNLKTAIAPGYHNIKMSKVGFKPVEINLLVKEDKAFDPIFKKLEPVIAKIEISVQPTGSKLFIDNKEKAPKEKLPLKFIETLQGGKKYSIKISNSILNVEIKKEISINDESPIVYNFDLSKKLELTINLYPASNNKLIVKGKGIPKKEYVNESKLNLSLNPGKYDISFIAKGITKDTTYVVSDKIYEVGTKTEVTLQLIILDK